MESAMTSGHDEGDWDHCRNEAKELLGTLIDKDLAQMDHRLEMFFGKLQKLYEIAQKNDRKNGTTLQST